MLCYRFYHPSYYWTNHNIGLSLVNPVDHEKAPPPLHLTVGMPEHIFDSSQSVDPAILNMMLGWGGASYSINMLLSLLLIEILMLKSVFTKVTMRHIDTMLVPEVFGEAGPLDFSMGAVKQLVVDARKSVIYTAGQ